MRILCVLFLWSSFAFADGKTEAALRAELAKAQDAAAASERKAADAIKRLAASQAGAAGQTTASRTAADNNAVAVSASNDASAQASKNAGVADTNAALAQQAVAAATLAAISASTQARADQFHGQIMLMMTSMFGFAGIIAGFLYQGYVASRDRRWAAADAKDRHRDSEARASADKHETLAAIHSVGANATEAIEKSNHLTEKIVAMREDLVTAVTATNAAMERKEDSRNR